MLFYKLESLFFFLPYREVNVARMISAYIYIPTLWFPVFFPSLLMTIRLRFRLSNEYIFSHIFHSPPFA